jgi:glycosyltransferase involved in cell wall biosynthesis
VVGVKKGMMGWDMKSGLQLATGRTLAVIDGDGQMPSSDVIRVYQLMKKNGLDFAKTYRVTRNDGSYRRLISVVYNILFKLLFPGINAWDMNSKPKIMTREFYEKLHLESNGWFIDAEIMILSRRLHAKIGEIETVFHSIDSRSSFVKPLSIFEFLGNLFWYRVKEFLTKK